ncbi:ribokinase [Salmonella enterica subsp. enterica]|nr:ribokinase [Salmonella enterica subsp. enterica]
MSSQSAIMVDAKEAVIVNYPSPDLLPDADWLNDIDFSQWDVVLADVRWHDGAKQAFTLARVRLASRLFLMAILRHRILARAGGVKATTPPSPKHPRMARPRAKWMSRSRDALKSTNAHKWTCVYVTRGDEGCNWLEKAVRHQPSFTVEVVDTCGAGDVFMAHWHFGTASGCAIEEAVRFASGVAAR